MDIGLDERPLYRCIYLGLVCFVVMEVGEREAVVVKMGPPYGHKITTRLVYKCLYREKILEASN